MFLVLCVLKLFSCFVPNIFCLLNIVHIFTVLPQSSQHDAAEEDPEKVEKKIVGDMFPSFKEDFADLADDTSFEDSGKKAEPNEGELSAAEGSACSFSSQDMEEICLLHSAIVESAVSGKVFSEADLKKQSRRIIEDGFHIAACFEEDSNGSDSLSGELHGVWYNACSSHVSAAVSALMKPT